MIDLTEERDAIRDLLQEMVRKLKSAAETDRARGFADGQYEVLITIVDQLPVVWAKGE